MNILFWNVDTQKDFINPDGKLYIKDAEKLKPNLKFLTKLATKYKIHVINTGDCHTLNSEEISNNPDFKTTFPSHCLIDSEGIEFIEETVPCFTEHSHYIIKHSNQNELDIEKVKTSKDIVILKDRFDVFVGNKFTNQILDILNPRVVVVYGVATDVCVNYAIKGLTKRKINVLVVRDAIKELPNCSLKDIYDSWISLPLWKMTCRETESFIKIGEQYDSC